MGFSPFVHTLLLTLSLAFLSTSPSGSSLSQPKLHPNLPLHTLSYRTLGEEEREEEGAGHGQGHGQGEEAGGADGGDEAVELWHELTSAAVGQWMNLSAATVEVYLNGSAVLYKFAAVNGTHEDVEHAKHEVEALVVSLQLSALVQAEMGRESGDHLQDELQRIADTLLEVFYLVYSGTHAHEVEHRLASLFSATAPPTTDHGHEHGKEEEHGAEDNLNVTFSLLFQLSGVGKDGVQRKAVDSKLAAAVAAVVAVEHARAYFGGVVPALGGEGEGNCSKAMRLGYELFDSRGDSGTALEGVLQGALMSNDVVRDLSASLKKENGGGRTIVVGPSTSQVAVPVSILMNVLDIPVISHAATSTELSNRQRFPTFARTIPADSHIARSMCDFFKASAFNVVAVLFVQDSYGLSLRDELIKSCAAVDVKIESFVYRTADQASVHAALQRIKERRLNVVTAAILAEDFRFVLQHAVGQNMTGPGKLWIYSDSLTKELADATLEAHPELAEGLNGSLCFGPESRDVENPVYNNLVKLWPTFENYLDDINDRLAELDVNKVGLSIDKEIFHLEHGARLDESVPFAYDAVVSAVLAVRSLACREFGATGELDDHVFHLHESLISGGSIYNVLMSEDFRFQGTSGLVEFDNSTGTRSAETSTYALANLLVTQNTENASVAVARQVGLWTEETRWEFNPTRQIVFPGGETNPPLFTAPVQVEYGLIEGWAKAISFTFAALVYLFCLGCLVWTCKFWKVPVVKASQPAFLVVFLMGIGISTTAVYTLAIDFAYEVDGLEDFVPVDYVFCQLNFWLISIGSTLSATSLIAKLYRINVLFNNPQMKRVSVTDRQMLLGIAACVLLNVTILLVLTLLNPVAYQRINTELDDFDRPLKSFGFCGGRVESSVPSVVLLFILYFFWNTTGAIFAFKTRKVSSDFQEAKWIYIGLLCQLQLVILGIPIVLAISVQQTTVIYLILSLIICLVNAFQVGLLFLPKIQRLLEDGGSVNFGVKQQSKKVSSGYRSSSSSSGVPRVIESIPKRKVAQT